MWLAEVKGHRALVDDRHGVLFAYGDLPEIERKLCLHGFAPGIVKVQGNHTHRFDPKQDDRERELFDLWTWQRQPLRPGDDD